MMHGPINLSKSMMFDKWCLNSVKTCLLWKSYLGASNAAVIVFWLSHFVSKKTVRVGSGTLTTLAQSVEEVRT